MHDIVWSKADLHLHTTHSDGGHSVQAMMAQVAHHTDLRVVAITDHDCIAGAREARRLAPAYGLEVIVGQEVTTARGHVLALYIEQRVPAGLSIHETVAHIHAQGGLAVLAHPFDVVSNSPMRHRPRPSADEWADFGVDALEALNGCQIDPRANGRTRRLARELGLPLTGSSDAHHTGAVGVAYTLFPGCTAADLRAAIELGTCRPAGRRWRAREYMGWTLHSLMPRTMRRATRRRRPLLLPEQAWAPEVATCVVPAWERVENGRS